MTRTDIRKHPMLKIVIFRISFLLITVSKIYRANIKRERMIRISPELIPRMNISLKMMFMFICSPPTPKHAFNVSSEAHFCYLKLLETHFCYLKASSGFLHSPMLSGLSIFFATYQFYGGKSKAGLQDTCQGSQRAKSVASNQWSMVQCGQDKREDLDKNPSNVRVLLQGYKKKIL